MFSYTGFSADQVDVLRQEHGIYLIASGRVCVAGLNHGNIARVASAFARSAHASRVNPGAVERLIATQSASQSGAQRLDKLDNHNQHRGGSEGGKGVETLIAVGDRRSPIPPPPTVPAMAVAPSRPMVAVVRARISDAAASGSIKCQTVCSGLRPWRPRPRGSLIHLQQRALH